MRGRASDVKREGVTFQNKTGSPETRDEASPRCDRHHLVRYNGGEWGDRRCPTVRVRAWERLSRSVALASSSSRNCWHIQLCIIAHQKQRLPGPECSPVWVPPPGTWQQTGHLWLSLLRTSLTHCTSHAGGCCRNQNVLHSRDSSKTLVRHVFSMMLLPSVWRPEGPVWRSLANIEQGIEYTSSLLEVMLSSASRSK